MPAPRRPFRGLRPDGRPGAAALALALCLGLTGAGPAAAQDDPSGPDPAPAQEPAQQPAQEPAPGTTVPAQTAPGATASASILTLDQDILFRESAWGRAAVRQAETDTAALAAENRRIEAALEAEERDLTERRPTLSPEDFAPLAEAFDTKVEDIRTAQDAKSRAITRRLEEDRQRFFEAAVPMLGQLLVDTGAVAILSDTAIIVSLTSIDVTEVAIARMDVLLPGPDAPADPPADPPAGPEDGGAPLAPSP
jgi:Skp family chaperone for outer membrane proteins